MTYRVMFLPSALDKMRALTPEIRQQFKQRLIDRAAEPHQQASQLHGFKNVFKIKLAADGHRLIYGTNDSQLVIYVIAVGKQELTLTD